MPPADTLRVYGRPGCHLCEQLVEELLPMTRGRLDVEVVDIDTHDQWRSTYATRIPVLEYAGEVVCQYVLDVPAVQKIIDTAGAS